MNRNCQTVQHDVHLARLMHKTPRTPSKSNLQTTPRKSERKRSLFEPSTPTNSEDLGPMSPLSASSVSSNESVGSPHFSPNGQFSTPPRTPRTPRTPHQIHQSPIRQSPRLSTMKLDVKSSLFPHLKLNTPKTHKTPRTPRSQIKKDTPGKDMNKLFNALLDAEQILKDLTTPPKSIRSEEGRVPETVEKEPRIVPETDTSPSTVVSLTPLDKNDLREVQSSPKPTKLGIKPISCESFYGPKPQPPKARTCLFIDTLEAKDLKKRPRSPSRDSVTSNRSFVSGSGHRRSTSSSGGRRSRSGNRRGPHVGVWHNIKKPKKMKKHVRVAKPLVSPNTRIKKMMKEEVKESKIEVKPKRLFEEKPRVRRAVKKRRINDSFEDDGIEDSFPDHLIKRKKLPSGPVRKETQVYHVRNEEPDPNKKFLKYGASKRATFTLNENVKLQITDGVMKLQSPKKRRKLYTAKRDVIDFYDDDEPDTGIEKNVENILSRLQEDKDVNDAQAKQLASPCKVQIQKITDTQLFNILENPSTKINLVEATPTKMITEIRSSPNHKLVRNLSTLALNENESNRSNESSLEQTGNMISLMTNILCNDTQDMDTYQLSGEEEQEQENASPRSESKLYSVFYKNNWNKLNNTISDITNTKTNSAKKKSIKVPDDQYLLDAGQKSVGIVTCEKCGVMYQAGDFADEATHNNFHNHLSDLKFNGWANERVVGKYQDGRVLMILPSDPKPWWVKVTKIIGIVDQELGFPEAVVSALHRKTVYLYIGEKAKQIVGCLIAEECKTAYKMLPPLEGIDVDTCSEDPTPCKIGISRIWTALNHRRCGVASRLIDCLQRTFMFGEIVPMDYIAFSVPSPSGKLLAQKVTGRNDFLVYGF